MFDPNTLLLFFAISIVSGLTPGPGLVYIVARSVQGGVSYGILSVLGGFTGGLIHIVAATLGLSALVMNSIIAFSVIKYLGAAYLVYLGIRTLLERGESATDVQVSTLTKGVVFRQGVITDVLKPKTALFFLAFIPQFINLEAGHVAVQFFIYGMLANAIFTLLEIAIALLAAKLGTAFAGKPRWKSGRKLTSGAALIGLGGFAAFADIKAK
ncbi:MAG: LysE family translocator [Chloroflexota bacterium]